jgi:hypothetical protein
VSPGGGTAGRGVAHLIAKVVERVGVRRAVWTVNRAARGAVRDAERAVARDALRRGETRTPTEILAALERDTVSRLSTSDRAAIHAFADRAAVAERSLTRRMQQIGGRRLAGLQYARKSEESLARKVATEMKKAPGTPVHEVLADVKDSVRYTLELPHGEYARAAGDAMARMRQAGFEPVGELKNFWVRGEGYRGINSVWRDTATGQVFEVQFHTEASLAAKEGTHRIYDFQRLPGLNPTVSTDLGRLQNRVFDHVPGPPDAAAVRWPQ